MREASSPKKMFLICLCFSMADLAVLDLYLGPRAFAQSESAPPPSPPPPSSIGSATAPPASAATEAPSAARAARKDARSKVPRIVARFGSDELAAYDDGLRALATAMIADPDATVVLEGHSDRRGPTEYNQSLSLERANWARTQLVLYGVSASRVETVGRGIDFPLDESDAESGSESRRVEVRWVDE